MLEKDLFCISLVFYIFINIQHAQSQGQLYDVTEFVTSTFLTIINPMISFNTVRQADQTSFAYHQISKNEVSIQGTISERMFQSTTFYRGPFLHLITNELLTKHYTTDALTGILRNTLNVPTPVQTYSMPGIILPTRALPFPVGYNVTRIVANTLETILSTNTQGKTYTFNHAALGQTISQSPINNVPFLSPGIITRTRFATNSFTNGPSTTYQTLIYYTFNFQLPNPLPSEELLPYTMDSGTFPSPNNYHPNNFPPNFPFKADDIFTNPTLQIFPTRPFNSEFFYNKFHEFWAPINPYSFNPLRNWPAVEGFKLISGNVTDTDISGIALAVTEITKKTIQTLIFNVNGLIQTSTVTGSNLEIHSSTLPSNVHNFGKFNQISTTANIQTISGTTIFGTTTFITHQYIASLPSESDPVLQTTTAADPKIVRLETTATK